MPTTIAAADDVPGDVEVVAHLFASGPEPLGSDGDLVLDALRRRHGEGKVGEVVIVDLADGLHAAVGLGPVDEMDASTYRRAGAALAKATKRYASTACTVVAANDVAQAVAVQAFVEGARLGTYAYDGGTRSSVDASTARLHLVGADVADVALGTAVAEAVELARDLINRPPSDMTPAALARAAVEVGARSGVAVEVWDEERIAAERLGGVLGVSRGSDQPPRFVRMEHAPAGATTTIALVGKGITFDSGGLSLKPSESMMTMKTDMSGAAAVIAAMSVLAAIGAPVRVLGFAAIAENLPGPSATKPGDVLRARNGTTMEVLNTDAEGRLVLADALCVAVEAEPDAIIDVATLTGACKVALGNEVAGLMSNDDALADEVLAAGERAGEALWRLPLPQQYRKLIDSDIADIKNISSGGAGALTAGLFLAEFVGSTPWVHLDIAGPARADGDDGYVTKGGTGFGVRTLIELVRGHA